MHICDQFNAKKISRYIASFWNIVCIGKNSIAHGWSRVRAPELQKCSIEFFRSHIQNPLQLPPRSKAWFQNIQCEFIFSNRFVNPDSPVQGVPNGLDVFPSSLGQTMFCGSDTQHSISVSKWPAHLKWWELHCPWQHLPMFPSTATDMWFWLARLGEECQRPVHSACFPN